MLTVSPTLETALLAHELGTNSFDIIEVVEVYASNYVPHAVNGYEPASAEKRWGGILGFTFLGLAYEREYIDRGDIHCYMDKKENNVTLNFSNISRQLAQWVQSTAIEGKQLVIRELSLTTSTVLADSLPRFVGSLDKPGDFGDESGSLSATQRFGQINQQFPPRTFSPNDPNSRAPNDPLFEGFRFTQQQASVIWSTRERRQGFGGLIGLTRKVSHSFQASSHSDVSANTAVPDAFGRVQLYGSYLATIDIGDSINVSVAVCEGPIADYVNIKQINNSFTQNLNNQAKRYGYLGGQGPVGREQVPFIPANPTWNVPGDGYYSRTAWFHGWVRGSAVDIDEATAPDWIILVKAKIITVPDVSGVFNTEEWSDNPAYIARFLLSDPRYFNEGEGAIEDTICWDTGLHCAGYVLDSTKGEWTYVPQADSALHGASFSLFRSTGLVDARRVRMLELGTLAGDPFLQLAEIEPFDPTDPPEPFDPPTNTNLRPTVLRVRHTCNVTLTERMSGLDFLHNVVAPSGRLFFRRNGKGRIEILTEKPADNTRLRAAAAPAATTVLVTDVDPWKTGLLLTQKLLIGNTLTTSESRAVTAAAFTADGNSITLASSGSGGVTATASGANLTGGSSTVAASGTVTLSGTVAGTVTVTINGLVCSYALDSFDSLNSAAILLARYINATPKLNQFIKATYSGAVVTVTAKWGVLTLNTALANGHTAEVANPVSAPTLAAAAGGALPAGTWWVGYAYQTVVGSTSVSPLQSVVVTVNQKINVTGLGALPGGVLSVDWYISKYAGHTEIVFWANNDGTAFSIGTAAAPTSSNSLPPDYNESGEEILRVAMSLASNDQGAAVLAQTGLTKGNIHAGSFKWPLPGKQSSTNLVSGTFFDATDDYAPTPLEVHDYGHQLQIRKTNKKDADLSAFDNYSQASRYLNFLLSKNREGDWFDSLSAGPYAMLLEEGDIYCASSDNGGLINVVARAEEISIGPAPTYTVKITGRKYSTLMFSDRVRQHSIRLPTTLRAITPIPSAIEFIDGFPLRDGDGLIPGFYVAVSFDKDAQGSWRGWRLKADYGDGYTLVAEGDVAAVIGTATSTPGTPADPEVFDTVNTGTFSVTHGLHSIDLAPFGTVTQNDLEANPRLNLFRWGTEYLQAATITDNGNHSYTLSDLYRGRFDTNSPALMTHGAGEKVIFLSGAEQFVAIDQIRRDIPYNYKVITVNQDDADGVIASFTWTGGTIKPPAPDHMTIYRDRLVADATRAQQIQFVIPTPVYLFGDTLPPVKNRTPKFLVDVYSTIVSGVFTANAGTDVLTTSANHVFDANTVIAFSTSGVLPAPLKRERHYFLRDLTLDTFKLSAIEGGPAIDITSAGTGTHSYSVRKRQMTARAGFWNPAILYGSLATTPGAGGWKETTQSTYTYRNTADAAFSFASTVLGDITETGYEFEFTLALPPASAGEARIDFESLSPTLRHTMHFTNLVSGGGLPSKYIAARRWLLRIKELVGGTETTVHTEPDYEMPDTRYRVQFSGSEVRFYRNYAGPGSELVYRSTLPPKYPGKVEFLMDSNVRFTNIMIGGKPESITTYPDTDQTLDFGTQRSTHRFRVYEEKLFEGYKYLSDATDFET